MKLLHAVIFGQYSDQYLEGVYESKEAAVAIAIGHVSARRYAHASVEPVGLNGEAVPEEQHYPTEHYDWTAPGPTHRKVDE